MTTYNTNLAAEFYVLSVLHRLGGDATLTLGNKKAVDMGTGRVRTVDVKGVAGRFDWPADNIVLPAPTNHFFVLVSFEGRISSVDQLPACWIVPAGHLRPFIHKYNVRRVIRRAVMRAKGGAFRDAWWRLVKPAAEG